MVALPGETPTIAADKDKRRRSVVDTEALIPTDMQYDPAAANSPTSAGTGTPTVAATVPGLGAITLDPGNTEAEDATGGGDDAGASGRDGITPAGTTEGGKRAEIVEPPAPAAGAAGPGRDESTADEGKRSPRVSSTTMDGAAEATAAAFAAARAAGADATTPSPSSGAVSVGGATQDSGGAAAAADTTGDAAGDVARDTMMTAEDWGYDESGAYFEVYDGVRYYGEDTYGYSQQQQSQDSQGVVDADGGYWDGDKYYIGDGYYDADGVYWEGDVAYVQGADGEYVAVSDSTTAAALTACETCAAAGPKMCVLTAAASGHTQCLEAFLQADYNNVYACDGANRTAGHLAAAYGQVESLQKLIEWSADMSTVDVDGRTPLFFACASNQFNCVALLVDTGFEYVDLGDARGDTPLHAAACKGHTECVDLLLQTAADPDSTNQQGHTPAHLAANRETMRLLYDSGANIAAQDKAGRSPLFCSCATNRLDVAAMLLEADSGGFSTDLGDLRGDTPLHASACNGNFACVELLLQFAANPTVANHGGYTPAALAELNGHRETLELLVMYDVEHIVGSVAPPAAIGTAAHAAGGGGFGSDSDSGSGSGSDSDSDSGRSGNSGVDDRPPETPASRAGRRRRRSTRRSTRRRSSVVSVEMDVTAGDGVIDSTTPIHKHLSSHSSSSTPVAKESVEGVGDAGVSPQAAPSTDTPDGAAMAKMRAAATTVANAISATSKWSAHLDPDSGYYYYWNQDTDEVTWEEPQEYRAEQDAAARDSTAAPGGGGYAAAAGGVAGAGAGAGVGGGGVSSDYEAALAAAAAAEPVKQVGMADETGMVIAEGRKLNKDYGHMANEYKRMANWRGVTWNGDITQACVCCMCNKREVDDVIVPCEHTGVCRKCIKKHNIGPARPARKPAPVGEGEGKDKGSDGKPAPEPWAACPVCMGRIEGIVPIAKSASIPRNYGPGGKLPKSFKLRMPPGNAMKLGFRHS